jgi:hypothetical protein
LSPEAWTLEKGKEREEGGKVKEEGKVKEKEKEEKEKEKGKERGKNQPPRVCSLALVQALAAIVLVGMERRSMVAEKTEVQQC